MKRLLQFLICILVFVSATAANYQIISLETLQPPRPGTFMTTTSDSEQDKIPDDSNRLPVNEEVTFINENYIWQYNYPEYYKTFYNEMPEQYNYPEYCESLGEVPESVFYRFKGTQEIEGKTYHCLYNVKVTTDRNNVEKLDIIPEFDFESMEPAYYIRQEGQKYYMLTGDVKFTEYWGDYTDGYGSPTVESLIYDFDAPIMSLWTINPLYGEKDWMIIENQCEVRDYYDIMSCGNTYNVQVGTFGAIRELGCTSTGTLPCPTVSYHSVALDCVAFRDKFYLSSVRNIDGNYLYKKADRTLGVDVLEREYNELVYDGTMVRSAGDGIISIYDMSGRKVASGTGEIRTNGLPVGVYVACATGESGQSRMKIVVK